MLQGFPITGIPIIKPGDDLIRILIHALIPLTPQNGDVLVVTSKIISKAEGRFLNLCGVTPSAEAIVLGELFRNVRDRKSVV